MLVPRSLYPFDGHRFDRGAGIGLHYLDEGPREAPPVVMVHGNPTWSIYFRALVLALRGEHRCIVPDHVGMGLSDKPGDQAYRYTLGERIDDLERLLEHLGVRGEVTLVLHDWGGAIGMGWAVRHPERVARLVLMNTAAFHLPRGKSFPLALRAVRTPVGALLVRGGNAFARTAASVCTRRPMPAELRRAYVAPYRDWASRIATLRFVEDIPLAPADPAYAPLDRISAGLSAFASTPAVLFWGMRDFVFDHHFLEEWERRLPHAEVHRFEDAGHYVLEDQTETIVERVRRLVGEPGR